LLFCYSGILLPYTGPAKVALIQASPAVSKELEGDWEGTLAGPGASFPMIFHFKNQPDKTVSATMDIPVTNAMAIPINDVKQSGRNVEFGIKMANSSFQGAINQEGTEIAGKFIRNGAGTAIVQISSYEIGTYIPAPPGAYGTLPIVHI
jgi:hypothetical protein